MIDSIVKKEILNTIMKYLGNEEALNVMLFGSRANARNSDRSDYDIAVDIGKKVPLSILMKIEMELENLPILQKIEIVDTFRLSDSFKDAALKNSIVWKKTSVILKS